MPPLKARAVAATMLTGVHGEGTPVVRYEELWLWPDKGLRNSHAWASTRRCPCVHTMAP